MGILMALATWYWWRNARREHPALGRLELLPARRPAAVDGDEEFDDVVVALPADVNGSSEGAIVGAQPVLTIDPGLRGRAAATE